MIDEPQGMTPLLEFEEIIEEKSVEEQKEALQIEQYSVSQFSLEQIFIALARNQQEEMGQIAGMFSPEVGVID